MGEIVLVLVGWGVILGVTGVRVKVGYGVGERVILGWI